MLKKISLFFLFFFTIILSGCSDLFKEPPDHIEYLNPVWTIDGNIVFVRVNWSNKEGADGDTVSEDNIYSLNLDLPEEDNFKYQLKKYNTPSLKTGNSANQLLLYYEDYLMDIETMSSYIEINENIVDADYSPSSDHLAVETETGVKLYNNTFELQKELTNLTELSGWKYADEIIGTAEIDAGKVLRYITKENEIVKEILISSNVHVLQYYPDGKRVLCQLDENPIDGKIRFMKINKQEEKEYFTVNFAEETVLNIQLNPTNSEQMLFSVEKRKWYIEGDPDDIAYFPSGIAIINTDGTGKQILRQRETINK
ncbi:MAG: hypothetical protein GY718_12800 [Lentisphaerae bacterium]|nr:hypothetical protein [Lentisphaerota bacterium]